MGSDSISVQIGRRGSRWYDKSGTEQIEFRAAIHLSLNQLVLAYNLKRVMKVLGVVPLMDAMRA